MNTSKLARLFPWLLLAEALCVPVLAWAAGRQWQMGGLTVFALFPLLGLWAWSIMWTHYVYGTARLLDKRLVKNYAYSKVSGYMVLACIVLHPALLAWGLWRAGSGLPPGSYYAYVGQAAKASVLLGAVGLSCFLLFEVVHRLTAHPLVQKYWPWISLSQMVAMTLIFVHALRLGPDLQSGWFRWYWIALGVVLVPCFVVIARADWQPILRHTKDYDA